MLHINKKKKGITRKTYYSLKCIKTDVAIFKKKIKVLKTLMGVERFVNSIRSDTTRSGKFSYDD